MKTIMSLLFITCFLIDINLYEYFINFEFITKLIKLYFTHIFNSIEFEHNNLDTRLITSNYNGYAHLNHILKSESYAFINII